jgi:hypothetical protein
MTSYRGETVSKTSAILPAFSSTLTLSNPKCVVLAPLSSPCFLVFVVVPLFGYSGLSAGDFQSGVV